MSAWNDLVKKMFAEGRSKNNNFKLKDAMKAASKVYKKGSSSTPSSSKKSRKCSTLKRKAAKACGTKRRRRH